MPGGESEIRIADIEPPCGSSNSIFITAESILAVETLTPGLFSEWEQLLSGNKVVYTLKDTDGLQPFLMYAEEYARRAMLPDDPELERLHPPVH